MKSHVSTVELRFILECLSKIEVSGTDSGAVKCVDIIRNTSGEGGLLGLN